MNAARLKRPLLAAVVSGALLAGGLAVGSPALADTPGGTTATVTASDDPTTDPSAPATTEPTEAPTSPSADPTTSSPDPSPSEPGPVESSPAGDPTPSEPASPEPTTPPATEEPSPEPSTSTPPADVATPAGRFTLNTGAIWQGQRVTLTQGAVTDADTPLDQITRVVTWGDGATSTLKSGQAPIAKQYTKNGTYTVTLTVKDPAGHASKSTAVVKVTTPPVKFKLDRTTVWPGQKIKVTVSGVPSGTTRIYVDHGDGYKGDRPAKNQTFYEIYYHRSNGARVFGKVTIKANFSNKFGTSNYITMATVTVKKDTWKPVVKVNKPKNATKASSWKTVTGTVSDKGSGVLDTYVWVTRISGNKLYCYTPAKTWKRVYSEAQWLNCKGIYVKANSKGKWSLKVNGLKKGQQVLVEAVAYDWADNRSKWSTVSQKLKKS